ncbi:MAG: septum formation initiator family protein [Nitrospirae bacterium]|nr:septum formation initiator family protein [Nitrospirota bacterium]MBI3391868.1 septum formation initiator family protein [Nitrospirota bacterium]
MAGFLLGIYLFFSFLFSDMGLVNYLRLGQTARNLEAEIAALKKENDRLRDEVEDLKTDPQTIERLARERLGMAREGDTVFQFEKNPPSR